MCFDAQIKTGYSSRLMEWRNHYISSKVNFFSMLYSRRLVPNLDSFVDFVEGCFVDFVGINLFSAP